MRDGCGRIPRPVFVIIRVRVTKSLSHHIMSNPSVVVRDRDAGRFMCVPWTVISLPAPLPPCRHAAAQLLVPKVREPTVHRDPRKSECARLPWSYATLQRTLTPITALRLWVLFLKFDDAWPSLAILDRPWPCAVLLQSALCCVLLSLSRCRVATLGRV